MLYFTRGCGLLLGVFIGIWSWQPIQAQDSTLALPATEDVALLTTDEAIAQQLQRIYASIDVFEQVNAAVQYGVVRLTGSVLQSNDKDDAAAIAEQLPNVVYVVNNIETEVELEARLTPAMERIQSYVTDTIGYLPILGLALVVLIFFVFLGNRVHALQGPFRRLQISPLVSNLIRRILRTVIWLIGVLLVFDMLGVTSLVGAVLGAAGLVGIAIGFAFQDIVENYLAGLLMSVRQPFSLNDFIQIGSEQGKVLRLTSRELILMTPEGNHVRLPNAHVFKSTLYNYTRNPRRRFGFEVGVDVEEELLQVREIGLQAMRAMPGILDDPAPSMQIKALGDFNVILTFFGWVDQTEADFLKVRSEAIRLVKAALDAANVLMPEPIYNVRMQTVTAPTAAGTTRTDQAKASQEVAQEVQTVDVALDDELDAQIAEDLRNTREPNLLTDTGST